MFWFGEDDENLCSLIDVWMPRTELPYAPCEIQSTALHKSPVRIAQGEFAGRAGIFYCADARGLAAAFFYLLLQVFAFDA